MPVSKGIEKYGEIAVTAMVKNLSNWFTVLFLVSKWYKKQLSKVNLPKETRVLHWILST